MCNVCALEISSLNDFVDFTNNVNNGISNYAGETVLLTNNLDMTSYSSSFVPVGNSTANTFLGTFDGQGHVISNLVVSSDKFRYFGIFGYSKGTTIKNLVVDKSCSFESNYLNNVYYTDTMGGILGLCESKSEKCTVEGCVNMAKITYSGINSNSTCLGGIVGKFTPVNYDTSITNCVNYGNISSTSTSFYQTRIGGITGEVWTGNSISFTNTIKDCANFGALYKGGSVIKNMYIGGISAVDKPNIVYENCVSLGDISYNESIPTNKVSVGSISGRSNGTTFKSCFWDDSLGLDATGSKSEDTTIQEGTTSLDLSQFTNGQDILETLMERTTTSFSVINLDSRGGSAVGPVILFLSAATGGIAGVVEVMLPSPVRVESTFRGWYSDEDLTAEFDASGLSAGNTTVYAKWDVNNYTVTFSVDGGVYNESSQEYGAAITYPPTTPTMDGFTFDGWNKTITTVPAHNVTIESLWTVNKYAVTFSVDGDVYNESSQEYGAVITYPPTAPTMDGFTFDGWYNDSAFTNKASTDLTVRGNLTLYGRFISTTIRIEFITKDLSTEDMVKEIERVAGCTECFTIIKMENDINTPTVIVKFSDASDAVDFMRTLNEYTQKDKKFIARMIKMVSEGSGSFSPLTTTPSLFIQFFL